MPEFQIVFTWYKDPKGYRLVYGRPFKESPAPAAEARRWAYHPDRDFERILNLTPDDIEAGIGRIVRNGGALERYQPLAVIPDLFTQFINKGKSDEGVLAFVKTYGPLTFEGLKGKGDHVPKMMDHAQEMSDIVSGSIIATSLPPRKLNAWISVDRKGTHLKVGPECLLDAIWLQFAQAKSHVDFRQCRQCEKLFNVGSRYGRRTDAKFCSDECRITFNSLERSR